MSNELAPTFRSSEAIVAFEAAIAAAAAIRPTLPENLREKLDTGRNSLAFVSGYLIARDAPSKFPIHP